jgi:HK97 family phage prohead protease
MLEQDPLAMNSWHRERLLEALEANRKGVGDAPLLRKWFDPGNQTATLDPVTENSDYPNSDDPASRPKSHQPNSISFVLSTDEVDRHGDVIATAGWNLDSYRKNPVFLWAHDYARPVIGRAVETWLEPHRLLARVDFAPTAFAQEVSSLYQAGYQRGVSVGFKPLKFEERRDEKSGALLGIRFLEQELLEVSAVPVPANRSALKRALDKAPLTAEYLRHCLGGTTSAGESPSGTGLRARSNSINAGGPAFEFMWSVISARIDDMAKLAQELVQEAEGVERAISPSEFYPRDENGVLEILELLRECRS